MMDPMIELPLLVRRNVFYFLDKRSKKVCRLVCNIWAERVDTEGGLSLVVKPEAEGNLDFIRSVLEPSSICFMKTGKIKPPEKYKKDDYNDYRYIAVLTIMLPTDFEFLKGELFPRRCLIELNLCGEFLWRSLFYSSTVKETLRFSREKKSCFLPMLKILKLEAREPEKFREVNDNYYFNAECREIVQKNIIFILNVIHTPRLHTLICKTISCDTDSFLTNINPYIEFITDCSQSLKILEMSAQPSYVIGNYGNSSSFPKLDEFKVTFYNLGTSNEITLFDMDGYWGSFIKSQTSLKNLLLEYSTTIPTDFLSSIILANKNSLEEISFACNYHNTHLVWVPENNMTLFDLSVFSECHSLQKLSMSSDWELCNLQCLPKNILHLGLEGCLITTENFLKLDLPRLYSIGVTRNILANSRQQDLEINEEVVRFLIHIRSLSIMFIEKRRNIVDTGVDELEEFIKAFAPIADEIPKERYYPEHYVALLMFQ